MRQIKTTKGKSLAIGRIPEGCRLCIKGQKLVLFATGLCKQKCWYCTVSKNRWLLDKTWANERLVKTDNDILDEARLCKAKGAGITGGEPLLRLERVLRYVRLLKQNFSPRFHIHLYTSGFGFPQDALKKLNAAGLDELRIHLNKELVKPALQLSWNVGMEVPSIPGQVGSLKNLASWLDKSDASFLNLNEVEFSDRNVAPMSARGFKIKNGSPNAVLSSENTAKKVLEWAKNNISDLNIHYCTAALKLDFQLRNRLKNRAGSIRKPFERITEDGMLLKGVILGDRNSIEKELLKMHISQKMFSIVPEKFRVETSVGIAKKIAAKGIFKSAVVREYPSPNPWDVEFLPL